MIWMWMGIGLVLAGVLLYFFLLHRNQETLIFRPERLSATYEFSFPGRWEELWITTRKQVRLNALLFTVDKPKGLILYFHGNAGSMRTWGEVAPHFTHQGWDVLLYDYRGYGKSTGRISQEQQMHRDAVAVYDWAMKRYSDVPLVFYGRSLGTGIAARLACEFPPRMLLLETPYYSFKDVVDHHYRWVPTSIILNYRFATSKFVGQVKAPVWLIHGTEDELVPYHSSVRLEQLGDHIELTTIEGGQHSDLSGYPEYQFWLAAALREVEQS